MRLLIAIPTKTAPMYAERMKVCEQTWLKDCPVTYKGFSDAELGLTEIDQHDNANDPIRTHRMRGMTRYAYDNGFDFMFRTDTDAYVWVRRLLKCGFEQYDYMGFCRDCPQLRTERWTVNAAHGGIGFFLSRRAMQIIVDSPVEKYADGKYWGDLWTGQQLWKNGIACKRDTRFLDGGRTGVSRHHGNIKADELPENHPYISIHPVNPLENYYAIHERFRNLPDETTAPLKQLWDN